MVNVRQTAGHVYRLSIALTMRDTAVFSLLRNTERAHLASESHYYIVILMPYDPKSRVDATLQIDSPKIRRLSDDATLRA